MIDSKKIYKETLKIHGIKNQILMVFEEMAELQKELCKFIRGYEVTENIAEEIADVEIMLEQMKMEFGIENAVELVKLEKIKRLEINNSLASHNKQNAIQGEVKHG